MCEKSIQFSTVGLKQIDLESSLNCETIRCHKKTAQQNNQEMRKEEIHQMF